MIGPLSYIGGKNRIANKIIEMFPEHTTYVEVFAGGAQVLFHKSPSKVEVLNDLDDEIVNFFRVCQHHFEELTRYLRFILVSRTWFSIFEGENPAVLTDIQRAARFFYLQKNAYGGLVVKRRYHTAVAGPPSFNITRLPEVIENAHQRLQRVQIEHLPFEEAISRYDRKTTLFYLDPPYWGRSLYRRNFMPSDFAKLAKTVSEIQGKFVLSINDVPEVRELFSQFTIREIEFAYSSQPKAGKRFRELLITNFDVTVK